jgi:hypothetical protein
MNTVGVDTSLTRFCPASASGPESRSTIAQLYDVYMTSTRMPSPTGWKITGMEASSSGVRPASTQDAAACLAIYRPYVQNTAISWEIDVPTVDEMAARIDGLRATHDWLVLEQDDQIIGFAYGSHAWPPSNRGLRPVSMSTSTITAPAEDASSTRNCCAGSPSGATGKPSPASPSNGFHRSSGLCGARPAGQGRPGWTGWPDHLLRRRWDTGR